jgi:virulence factor Mce-like protein
VNKQTPGVGRILVMVGFALSCMTILFFLWLAFGGPVPLKPEGYRFSAVYPEATTLAKEADVRIAGVNVGKVKNKILEPGTNRTRVQLELFEKYAPIPSDTRSLLRQKTLLGETYVELTPGSPSAPPLKEDAILSRNNVEESVEFDELLRIFDPETKEAFRGWVKNTAEAIDGGTGENFNDAIGNLAGFSADGADVLGVLESQRGGLKAFIRNTGEVFEALSEREGQLRSLIRNSNDTFEATASQKEALAESFRIFPTFLDESRATVVRLEEFSNDTRPLVRALRDPADKIAPTIRDVGALSPDLEQFFRDLRPLIEESGETLPEGARLLRGLRPVMGGLHQFLPEFNPILSYANYNATTLTTFLSVGASAFSNRFGPNPGKGPLKGRGGQAGLGTLPQFGVVNARSLSLSQRREPFERGTSYPNPNAYIRLRSTGIMESFDCKPNGGEQRDPREGFPPCFVEPDELWDGKKFPRLIRGRAPLRPTPLGNQPCNNPRNPPGNLRADCR